MFLRTIHKVCLCLRVLVNYLTKKVKRKKLFVTKKL